MAVEGIASIALDSLSLATSVVSSGVNIAETLAQSRLAQDSVDRQLKEASARFVDESDARRRALARQMGGVTSTFSAAGFTGGASMQAQMESFALDTEIQDIIAEREFFNVRQEALLQKQNIVGESQSQAINFALGGIGSVLDRAGNIATTGAALDQELNADDGQVNKVKKSVTERNAARKAGTLTTSTGS